MAWNQSATNSKNQNEESKILKKPECKRPKCVSFAFWWFIVAGIISLGFGFLHYLRISRPWPMCAGICVVAFQMLDCARMISKRNVTAVFLSSLTLFFSEWILDKIASAIVFALPPMIFLVLPHSIKWLKLNNRFSVSALIASALTLFVSGVLCCAPSVRGVHISNTNPLLVVSPGDKALHEVNKDYRHVYWCQQYNRTVGELTAQYNQNGKCCYIRLHGSDEPFWGNVTGFCNEKFNNRIKWSDAVTGKGVGTEEGLPMLCGAVDKNIIMIFPNDSDSSSGTLLVCDSQLNSELDFLFALPGENAAMSLLNDFLENRDMILSVERDVDDAQRNKQRYDMCEGLKELRDQAAMLELLALAILPPIGEIEDLQVTRTFEAFDLRRKTMHELACGIWWTANMAVTAIEYNTKALAMRRDERIKLRRQYLEEDPPVPDELLPMDPNDHSGQNSIFDDFARQFKEGREELYWELHEKTGYSLGRPYNPKFKNRSRRQSPAPDQGVHCENESSDVRKVKSSHKDPYEGFYGSKDRQKLFSSEFRKGLGLY